MHKGSSNKFVVIIVFFFNESAQMICYDQRIKFLDCVHRFSSFHDLLAGVSSNIEIHVVE